MADGTAIGAPLELPAAATALAISQDGARLAVAGVDVRPGDDPSGRRQVYVDDPFGNRIELLEA